MNEKRLRKAIEHVRNPKKRGHKKFDFEYWNVDKNEEDVPYKCSYAGCFLGEMPVCFPKEWKFSEIGEPVLRGVYSPILSASMFFGITEEEAEKLFLPYVPNEWGKTLTYKATPEEVCDNAEKFIGWKKRIEEK